VRGRRLGRRLAAAIVGLAAAAAVPVLAGPSFGPPAPLHGNAADDAGSDTRPQIATDGAGTWVAVWASTDDLGGSVGSDQDILAARSTDGGASWSAPAALGGAADGQAFDFAPHLATDGAGLWIAVWASTNDLGGTIGGDPDVLVARSTDGGVSWGPPAAASVGAGEGGADDRPWVASDGAGTWVIAWDSTETLGDTLGIDRDLLYVRSTDGGLAWSAPAALNANAGADAGLDQRVQVVAQGAGAWLAVWASTDTLGGALENDFDILLARSLDGAGSWSPPAALNGDAADDGELDDRPQLAVAPDGTVVAVWVSTDPLDGDLDLMTARSFDGGAAWSAPAPLDPTAADDDGDDAAPHLLTDGAGEWVAVWESTSTLDATVGADADVLMARSLDAGASWTVPLVLNAGAAGDEGSDVSPRLATDGGRWIAVWSSDDPGAGGLGTDTDVLYAIGLARCGDGVVDPGELCDDGNQEGGDGCTAACTLPATPTPTPTATPTPTPTRTTTPGGPDGATPSAAATAALTATPAADGPPSPDPTPTGAPTAPPPATGTATAGATATPSARETPGLSLPDRARARAAVKCQDAIATTLERVVRARFRALARCEQRLQRCLQLRPDDAACLDGAAERCVRALGTGARAEARGRAAVARRCGPDALDPADLLSASGLGYEDLAPLCEASFGVVLADAASVADCLLRQHACHVERMVEVLAPRTRELMRLPPGGGVTVDPLACLPDHGGSGEALSGPSLGTAVVRCASAIAGAGATFVRRGQRRYARCVGAVLACLQGDPTSAACLDKAAARCDKEFARTERDERRLGKALARRCEEERISFDRLQSGAGAGLDAAAPACAAVGVGDLASLAAYQECVVRHQTCRLGALARFALPRAPELLPLVGLGLEPSYCPVALPLETP